MKLTIKAKLIGYALSIFLVLNLIGAYTTYTRNLIDEYSQISNDLSSIWDNTLKLRIAENNFLLRETKNLTYFESGESQYLQSFNQILAEIKQIQSRLSSAELAELDLSNGLSQIDSLLEQYRSNFEILSVNIFQRGFKDFGLVGSMRESIHDLESNILSNEDRVYMLTLRRHEKDYLLRADPKYRDKLNALVDEMSNQMQDRKDLITSLGDYRSIFNEIVNLDAKIGYADTTGLYSELYRSVAVVEPAVNELTMSIGRRIDEAQKSAMFSVILIIVFGILISIVASIVVIRSIHKSVKSARKVINKVSKGKLNFEIRAEGTDEISELLRDLSRMVDKLRAIVGTVANTSNNVSIASKELHDSSELMSRGATHQAATAEEISASMEEITGSIELNNEHAIQTKDIAIRGANKMVESVGQVTKTMDSMKSITSKIAIIEEISRRTNLLALNAAIEAARAGQYGKGFAVVAAEIRRLAERTQEAAAQIDAESATGMTISESSKKLIEETLPQIEKTSELVRDISQASAEQNSSASQINNGVHGLTQTIQQNAAVAEQMAVNSQQLSAQAAILRETISYFDVIVDQSNDQLPDKREIGKVLGRKRKKFLKKAS
jgi:methyl-accepting chemotaxis protein